jgi:hypothetical protein
LDYGLNPLRNPPDLSLVLGGPLFQLFITKVTAYEARRKRGDE